MADDLITKERAEQLGRMATANELDAYDCEREGHFGLAKALLARAEDYRRAAAEIALKLAAKIYP